MIRDISSQSYQQPVSTQAPVVKKEEAAPQNTNDSVVINDEKPKNDITIKQAITGLGGALIGAGIEGVGNTASSIVKLPRATFKAAKAIWNTELIGPVLKTSLTALLPVAVIATPVLTCLGSIGYGLFSGFEDGKDKGLGATVKEAAQDVKKFHTEIAEKAVDSLQEIETFHLEQGQKPYDIKLVEAGKGLIGAVAGAPVEAVGVGGLALLKTPRLTYKAYESILKSDQGPVLKTTESLLVPFAAVLAAPLCTVGAAVYGVYKGFGDAYKDGLGESVKNRFNDISEFNKLTQKAFD
ncbi:MAG: hypothetical protein LWY06_11435 [Firmicutes bacterium]|nr:hypothetical protein [Bacillota bacterium]